MADPHDVIVIEQLVKNYYLGTQVISVLKGIDLRIKPNEFVALMGPSGSGKSTLMNILGCLDTPTSGRYTLNGQTVSDMGDEALAGVRNQAIGFVFQQFNLLPKLTALDNVALPLVYAGVPKAEREQRALAVLEQVNLADRAHHKPNELSGGQCQRVAIARALINKPALILADEPTGNLDTATSLDIMRIFDTIHRNGNTVVLVTHEEDIAAHARRVVRLRDGLIETDIINTNPTPTAS
jgi:putative ABC transport system ATP-binding protein